MSWKTTTAWALAGLLLAVGLARGVDEAPRATEPEPLPFVEGSWTLAVLPDTQVYTMSFPTHLEAMTRWIAENARARRIAYALQLGDVTEHNAKPQWEAARKAFARLDGVVPYAIAPGNHDYVGNAAGRETLLNEYFPLDRIAKWPTFGGTFEQGRLESSFHLFRAGGADWIVLALEWGPRDEVLAWADKVLTKHAGRRAVLITHAYLFCDDSRYDWKTKGAAQAWNPHSYGTANLPGGVNDGEEIWQKLLRKHAGATLVVSGHVLGDGLGYLASEGDEGNTVHQMLFNCQMQPEGGQGFLRLIEFLPDGKTVQCRTYSPVLDRYRTDSANQFVLELAPPLTDSQPASAPSAGAASQPAESP